MATKTTKKTTKKTAKMVEEVKEVLPESPDAADALASTAWVSVAKNLDLANEAKDETVVPAEEPKTEPPEMPKQPEWEKALEEDYGHIIRNRDQTALLTAILTELVKIRVQRG